MELDDKICYCFHISKRKIVNYIRVHSPQVASRLSECGGAGTGCGWCIPFLKTYFEEQRTGRADDSDSIAPDEYARGRGEYIRSGAGVPPSGATPPPPVDKNGSP